MANMKDVAKAAGVSVSTVSRVMNNHPAISEKTRKRVTAIMEEPDFRPNEMARYLQTGRSHIIGLVIPFADHPFFSMLTAAVSKACKQNGYRLMLCTSEDDTGVEQEMISMLRSNKVDGILIASRSEHAEPYADLELPVVSIERSIDRIPSISCDNHLGGVLAAQALKNAGCTKVLMIADSPRLDHPAVQRPQGFLEECERLALPCQVHKIPEGFHSTVDFAEIPTQYPDVDGYFTTSDVLAVRLFKTLLNNGKISPRDFKLVGFDGMDISRYFDISTIAQPIREMGELGVEFLLRRIEGQLIPSRTILPVRLIERSTTGK